MLRQEPFVAFGGGAREVAGTVVRPEEHCRMLTLRAKTTPKTATGPGCTLARAHQLHQGLAHAIQKRACPLHLVMEDG